MYEFIILCKGGHPYMTPPFFNGMGGVKKNEDAKVSKGGDMGKRAVKN